MTTTENGNLILAEIKRARYEAGVARDNETLASIFDGASENLREELSAAGMDPKPHHVAEIRLNTEVAAILRAAAATATTDLPRNLYNKLVAGVPFEVL